MLEGPSPLFRSETISSSTSSMLGQISLVRPVSSWIVASLSVIISGLLVAYLAYGTVTRKTHVTGMTVPKGGRVTVYAPYAAVLVRTFVSEGESVAAGQKLFELSTERESGTGEVTALLGKQIAVRLESLQIERKARITQDGQKRNALEARVNNIATELTALNQEIELAQERRALALQTVEKFSLLESGGFVSSTQSQQRREDLIDMSARLGALNRNRVQLRANELSTKAELTDLAANLNLALIQIDRSEASLKQEMLENRNRKGTVITSPLDGVLTTIVNEIGQSMGASQVLATILPKSRSMDAGRDDMEVHLYTQSRNVGFVKIGQIVKIRYQAFPYQKFGIFEGKVSDISITPLSSAELPASTAGTIFNNVQQNSPAQGSAEGLYRIKVQVDKQYINVYGQRRVLTPGMTLDADLVQEERKLWEWALEPVLALSAR